MMKTETAQNSNEAENMHASSATSSLIRKQRLAAVRHRGNGRKRKMLVVEDSPLWSFLFSELLTDSGYEVARVATVSGAALALKKEKPDLVIIDLLLPDGSGFEVLNVLRRNASLRDVPALILTNLDSRVLAEEAAALGAQAFLMKNKPTAEILEMVQKLVDDTARLKVRVFHNLDSLERQHKRRNLS